MASTFCSMLGMGKQKSILLYVSKNTEKTLVENKKNSS